VERAAGPGSSACRARGVVNSHQPSRRARSRSSRQAPVHPGARRGAVVVMGVRRAGPGGHYRGARWPICGRAYEPAHPAGRVRRRGHRVRPQRARGRQPASPSTTGTRKAFLDAALPLIKQPLPRQPGPAAASPNPVVLVSRGNDVVARGDALVPFLFHAVRGRAGTWVFVNCRPASRSTRTFPRTCWKLVEDVLFDRREDANRPAGHLRRNGARAGHRPGPWICPGREAARGAAAHATRLVHGIADFIEPDTEEARQRGRARGRST